MVPTALMAPGTATSRIILDFSGQGSIFGSCGVGSDGAAVGGGCGARVAGARDTLCRRTVLRRRRAAGGDVMNFDELATVCEFYVE